ncbi:MAG: diaminopimelate decarboxylase [Pseudohongiellaceae bacterium]
MDHFNFRDGRLFAEELPVADIAGRFGTPCYIYSRATLEHHFSVYEQALAGQDHLICYAVKANSNLAVLDILARQGAGFDIVSGGELERVLAAGGRAEHVIFSGIGKSAAEIGQALRAGILCFNVESESELRRINTIAGQLGCRAPVSLRVNPDVDAGTHPYISTGLRDNKFGIVAEQALEVYRQAREMAHVHVVGVDCHIGSQLTSLAPFLDALDRILVLVDTLAEQGIAIRHLDIGGGLGVTYREESPPDPATLVTAVRERLRGRELTLLLEPGRSIAANAGIFVTRVEYLKHTPHKNFAIVDGAMNDLLRPALYNAWQEIVAVDKHSEAQALVYDVVGPVCESADFLGKDRPLQLSENGLLAIRGSGAYGFVMSSNYNSRPRAAEIMVDGETAYLVRRRETVAELLALESVIKPQ